MSMHVGDNRYAPHDADDSAHCTWESAFLKFLDQQLELLNKASHRYKSPDRLYVLRWAAKSDLLIDGWWAEFGVYEGTSINLLARIAQQRRVDGCAESSPASLTVTKPLPLVFGFDSFQGLPSPDTDGRQDWLTKRFDLKGVPPVVDPVVELVPGWFSDTVPPFLRRPGIAGRPAALVHVDCDIHSSALCVLTQLTSAGAIVPGTVIVFDELLHYPGYERHELRALWDWARRFGAEWDWVCVKDRVMPGAASLGLDAARSHRELRAQGYDQAAALRVRRIAAAETDANPSATGRA